MIAMTWIAVGTWPACIDTTRGLAPAWILPARLACGLRASTSQLSSVVPGVVKPQATA
jgi:hypothetical protein